MYSVHNLLTPDIIRIRTNSVCGKLAETPTFCTTVGTDELPTAGWRVGIELSFGFVKFTLMIKETGGGWF